MEIKFTVDENSEIVLTAFTETGPIRFAEWHWDGTEEGVLHATAADGTRHTMTGVYPVSMEFEGLESTDNEMVTIVGSNKMWEGNKDVVS